MSMIHKASLAAALLAAAVLPLQAAGAGPTVNGQISQVAHALGSNAYFSPSGFTFGIGTPGSSVPLFSGIAGVRAFNDFQTLNDWVAQTPPASEPTGAPYTFTHSVLGNYFDQVADTPAPEPYAAAVTDAARVYIAPPSVPIPEPATWAMMIGGLALAGFALRRSRSTISFV